MKANHFSNRARFKNSDVISPSGPNAQLISPMLSSSATKAQVSAPIPARIASATRVATFLGWTVKSRLRPRSDMNLKSNELSSCRPVVDRETAPLPDGGEVNILDERSRR